MKAQKDSSIQHLLKYCSKGDTEAFHELYLQLDRVVFAFLAARTATREDAKDLLQDVALDLWKGVRSFSYRSDKQFYAFVFIIARRRLAKYYDARVQTTQLHENIADETPHQAVEYRLECIRLIDSLPKKMRLVMELRYIADLPFADIADRLNEKETTVKVRHHRALAKLKRLATQV